MEIAKQLLSLLKELAWPMTILAIALLFRAPITALCGAIFSEVEGASETSA